MNRSVRLFVAGGLLVALALAGFASPFASGAPDGLERVAQDHGLDAQAREHRLSDGPLAEYSVEGVADETVSTGLAGALGVLLTFGIGLLLFGTLRALCPAQAAPD